MARTRNWRDYPKRPYRSRSATVIAALDALSRTRALTEAESLQLEWAIRQEEQNRTRRPALHERA